MSAGLPLFGANTLHLSAEIGPFINTCGELTSFPNNVCLSKPFVLHFIFHYVFIRSDKNILITRLDDKVRPLFGPQKMSRIEIYFSSDVRNSDYGQHVDDEVFLGAAECGLSVFMNRAGLQIELPVNKTTFLHFTLI